MKREEKNGGPMQGRLHIKTTQIPPFFCCVPVFQSLLSLCIPLSLANFSHLRKKFARLRIIVVILFLFIIFFFLMFVCIKGHPSSDSGPSKEISWKESKLKTMKRPKCQRWWRAGKQEIAWASCVRVVFISRIFIHTVRKGNFATQDWAEVGTTKWKAFV